VALGTLPHAAESATPLADAAAIFLGNWGGLLMTAGAVVSILGTNSNSVLAGPRYLLAMARDGYGPRFLAAIHPTFRTPARAILLQTAIALPLALSGTFTALAALSVVARLTSYVGTAAAVPVLRRKLGRGGWQLPFGSLIPLLAAAISLSLAASASARSLLSAGVALLLGLIVFRLRRGPSRA
jgi:amino acid transporter